MSFLDGAFAMREGLLVPGDPPETSATLILGPEAAILRTGRTDVALPWTSSGWTFYQRLDSTNNITTVIFGVSASGSIGAELTALHSALARVARNGRPADQEEHRVHVFNTPTAKVGPVKEMFTLLALGEVLRVDPTSRQRLTDLDRVTQLVQDIRAAPQSGRNPKLHVSPKKAEIVGAMTALGYVHRFRGRPVPGVTKDVTRDDAIAAVLASLRTSAYHHGALPTEHEVGELLDSDYFDITPWPFAALTQEHPLVTASAPPRGLRRWWRR